MFKPDFLIIPYAIKSHEDLRPSDGDVYAAIYWFERLKDGKCTASNETLADVACCGTRNVRGALDRLEKEGFIERVWKDPETRTQRAEIKTLLHYSKVAPGPQLPARSEPREETPGEFAKRFFGRDEVAVGQIINDIIEKTGAPEEAITQEVQKFMLYWTEPNKSGTKERWQTEKTFEVRRRLYTWLSRAGKMNRTQARAGAGRVV
jgi:hypothetical protein